MEDVKKWRRAAARATTPGHRRKFARLADYEQIKRDIAGCTNCGLCEKRTNTVPLDQAQPRPVALVGEAPGSKEDEQGKPFVGQSGALLDRTLEEIGHSRDEVVVMNTVACRPPHNRDPKPEETAACRPLFDRQLEFSGAWIVVLMGNKALRQFFPGLKITTARGKPMWTGGRIYVPTYHPAYVLRNRKQGQLLSADLSLAFQIHRGEKWWDPPNAKSVAQRSKDSKDLTYALDNQGWARIYSRRLDDEIIVIRDKHHYPPAKHIDLPRYTMEELIRIGELGRGPKLTAGELASIHLVKRLGGVVVQ